MSPGLEQKQMKTSAEVEMPSKTILKVFAEVQLGETRAKEMKRRVDQVREILKARLREQPRSFEHHLFEKMLEIIDAECI